jgi:hypothetical protein
MPGAGRTRASCVQKTVHFAHASNNRAARTTGTPCAMVLTAYARALLGVPGLIAPVACGLVTRKLDTSVGVPGPRDLAVRMRAVRLAALTRPSHPAPNTRDDREAPLLGGAGRGEITI